MRNELYSKFTDISSHVLGKEGFDKVCKEKHLNLPIAVASQILRHRMNSVSDKDRWEAAQELFTSIFIFRDDEHVFGFLMLVSKVIMADSDSEVVEFISTVHADIMKEIENDD